MEKKVVIVTGASSGIGQAVAQRAAHEGYRVVINARREDRLAGVAARIRASGGEALVVAGDIADLSTQHHLVEQAVAHFGRLDVLVNNAGFPLPGRFAASPAEELRRQWDVNVSTLSTLTRIALPHLQATRGTVVNIGSAISHFPVPGMGNYAPTKIAVAALSDALLLELAPLGVKVCLVEPGPINTEFSERAGRGSGNPRRFHIPVARSAISIVRLFEHPRPRIAIPEYLGPVLILAGFLTRLFLSVAKPLLMRAALKRPR